MLVDEAAGDVAVMVPVLTGEVATGVVVGTPPVGLQHWSVQPWPAGHDGVGGEGVLGTQHSWSWCHHQVEGHDEPEGGEGGLG